MFRGDAIAGKVEPYEVETYPGMVVLDAIHEIQAKQEPTLASPVELQGGAVRVVQRGDQRASRG